MYERIFDHNMQMQLNDFFINEISHLGKMISVKKGQIINPKGANNIYLVIEGELNELMYSINGDEIIFFRITRGSIFNEEDFFDNNRTHIVYKAITNSKVSIVDRDTLEKLLYNNPNMYKYFLKSIILKQRLIMMEISNYKFNDSTGKVADFLIRLYFTEDKNIDSKNHISIILTHEEIANRVGLNRATVTKIINNFKSQDIIYTREREIIINDIEKLIKLSNLHV